MTDKRFSPNEQKMLYWLMRYPTSPDRELAKAMSMKPSTVSSIRKRLQEKGAYRIFAVPLLQDMGCEMLVNIHTNFNPTITVQERGKITGKVIEVFEEVVFSIGEANKGFSISLAGNYADIAKINDIRTETFSKLGLLDDPPQMVVFPFGISHIQRFLNFAPLAKKHYSIDNEGFEYDEITFKKRTSGSQIKMTEAEKHVFHALVKYPNLSNKALGDLLPYSRHTVSLMKKNFEEQGLLKYIIIPDIMSGEFEILAFQHVKFNPRNPPDIEKGDLDLIKDDNTFYMASRRFEMVRLGLYPDYDSYKIAKESMLTYLKEKEFIVESPLSRVFRINGSTIIKDFTFSKIVAKLLDIEDDL